MVNTAVVAVAANSKVLLATFTLDNDGIDETVLRVVGGLTIASDQSASSESQLGALGMLIVTDQVAGIGVASMPDPVTDVGDDYWFFYQGFAQSIVALSAIGFDPRASTYYPFDSKAKRIVSSGQTIAVIAANAHATHTFTIAVNLRILSMVRGTH